MIVDPESTPVPSAIKNGMHSNCLAGHAIINGEWESFGEKPVIAEMH
jgi:hypothetical protein